MCVRCGHFHCYRFRAGHGKHQQYVMNEYKGYCVQRDHPRNTVQFCPQNQSMKYSANLSSQPTKEKQCNSVFTISPGNIVQFCPHNQFKIYIKVVSLLSMQELQQNSVIIIYAPEPRSRTMNTFEIYCGSFVIEISNSFKSRI